MVKDEVILVDGQDTGEGKWSQHPELLRTVVFRKVSEPPLIQYVATINGSVWKILINDFPSEPLYTILFDGKPIMSFNDWPEEIWQIEE